jgi:hypothetical protein
MNDYSTDIASHLVWDCDFPHPDWACIRRGANEIPAELRHPIWAAQERAWLELLRDHLGGAYALHESSRTFLLTEQPGDQATATLDFLERALDLLVDALEGAADTSAVGKHVVLLFTEDDDYYSYVSHYFPDGHFGLVQGVCIRAHEVHIAVNGIRPNLHETLTHELVHDLLSHRALPLWLEEGIAQLLTRYALDRPHFDFAPHLQIQHGQHWHWHGLEPFWTGAAFSRPDDLQHLSYQLAELLARQINATDPRAFNAFLLDASPADAGEGACRRHFHVSLLHFVSQILGPGPWFAPNPQAE